MRAGKVIFLIFAFVLALGTASFAADSSDVAIITYIEGDVKVRANENSAWKAAELEMALQNGSSIRTGANSKAKFALEDDSVAVVGALSVFDISEVAIDSAKGLSNSSFYLQEGMVRAEVTKLTAKGASFEIHTPSAIAGVRGTDFVVEAAEDTEQTTVTVLDGEVELGNKRGKIKKMVRILKEHAADVRGEDAPGEPKKANIEKLKKLKEIMAHKLKDKVKGKFAELDDEKAATLIALKRAGMDKEMVSGLVSGMKGGEVPAGRIKDVLSLASHGAGKGELGEALGLIKDRKLEAKDIQAFVKAAKERGGANGVREELKKFKELAGKMPGRGRAGERPYAEKLKDRAKGAEEAEKLEEQVDKTEPNDPKRRELALMRYALEKGVPKEKIEGLLRAYREGRLDHTETKMLIGAVAKGVDPAFLKDLLVRMDKMKVDRKVRLLLLTALEVGIPREQFKTILTKLENKEITIEQVREYIKKQLQENPPPKPGVEKKAPPTDKKK